MRASQEKHVTLVLIVLILVGILFTNRVVVRGGKETSQELNVVDKGEPVVFPLDINEADVETLVLLPGIGKVKARAIVQYREKNGCFSSVDDLVKVPGINIKTLERLRPYITVSKGATCTGQAVRKLVNINEATVEELESLPGIGQAKARAIVEYREKRGGFKKVEELLEVPGIGPRIFEMLRPYVEVGGR